MAENEPSVGRVDLSWKATWVEENTRGPSGSKPVVLPYPGRSGAGVGGGTGSISGGHLPLLESFCSRLATCPHSHQDRCPKHQFCTPHPKTNLLTTYPSSLNAQPGKLRPYNSWFPLFPLNHRDLIDQPPHGSPDSFGCVPTLVLCHPRAPLSHPSKPHWSIKHYTTLEKAVPECGKEDEL